jgi:dihydroorotate dehydrogenase (NAD+) catalytic subunit
MSRLNIDFCGVAFKNPVIPASGTFGYGREYEQFYPLSKLGGISVKGTTLNRREGNPGPRVAETPSGMLNSVGLQNGGVKKFLEYEMPNLVTKDTRIIANIAGATVEECAELAAMLEGSAVDLIELNISCPNVKAGGAAFGTDCTIAGQVTRAVKDATNKPLMVKLSPNVTSITDIAKSVEANGADAVSLINTLLGMRIDIKTGRLHHYIESLCSIKRNQAFIFNITLRPIWQNMMLFISQIYFIS